MHRMNSQNHLQSAVPEAFGTAIPSNPAELLKFLKLQKQQKEIAEKQNGGKDMAVERLKKQDYEREQFELIQMGQEDVLSENLSTIFKEYDQERFKAKVRLEVEQRQAQERAEKEARRKAAEERRAAAVERIRRQKELEEQRKREAELALQRIEEEKLRKIREEEEKFRANQEQMIIEDQYSMLVEQEYRDWLEKQLWQQREKERLLEWEKEQQRKDQLEEAARQARMKELEEKKRKLELLRKQQQQSTTATTTSTTSKEQAEKMNKQLRIQNRAKFVSKKIAEHTATTNPLPGETTVEVIDLNGSKSAMNALFPPALPTSSKPVSRIPSKATTPRRTDDHNSNPHPHDEHSHKVPPATAVLTRHLSTKQFDAIIFQSNSNPSDINHQASSSSHHNLSTSSIPSLQRQSSLKLSGISPQVQLELQSYEQDIQQLESEVKLRSIHNDLMMKKRAIRIEQRQKMMHQIDENIECHSNADGNHLNLPLTHLMNDTMKQQLYLLSEKMMIVEKRLQIIQQLQQENQSKLLSGTATEKEEEEIVNEGQGKIEEKKETNETKKPPVLSKQKSLRPTPSADQIIPKSFIEGKSTPRHSRPPSASKDHQLAATSSSNTADLFKQCETTLRTGNKQLMLTNDVFSVSTTAKPPIPAASLQATITTGNDLYHHLTSLSLEILQLNQQLITINKIHEYDPLGYREKLPLLNDRITNILPKLQKKIQQLEFTYQEMITSSIKNTSSRPSSSGSQKRPPVKIFSRTNSASNHQPPSQIEENSNNSSPSKQTSSHQDHSSRAVSPRIEKSMMSSISEPVIASVQEASDEQKKKSPRVIPGLSSESDDKVIPITADNIQQEILTDSSILKSTEVVEEENDEFNPNHLPGWEECIYTSMYSAAHHAAFFGYHEVLDFLCKYFDCFIMDQKGRTPLFYAALANRLDCVAMLIALDPQWIDVGDEQGDTILHAATISNSLQVLAFILSCEIHPDIANHAGLTPSHLARSREALELLHNANAQLYCVDNLSRMPLWYSCADNRIDCVEYLCEKTPTEFLLWKDQDGDTCLHIAASKGYEKCIDLLCQYLVQIDDINIINAKKYTPAHIAANAAVLQVLYENGANLWLMEEGKGRIPLFIASFFGRIDCVAFLLELATNLTNSPNPHTNNNNNAAMNSPVMLQVMKGKSSHLSISHANSSSSLSVSTTSSSTSSLFSPRFPLHSSNSVSNLLEQIRIKDKQGDTVLHVAALCGHFPIVHLLLYYLSNQEINHQQLRPSDLARKANHQNLAIFMEKIETLKRIHTNQSVPSPRGPPIPNSNTATVTTTPRSALTIPYETIFGTADFHYFASIILYYHSRWGIAYDITYQTYYYIDYITNTSQWERPELFDLPLKQEQQYQKACQLLIQFYQQYNPTKINEIPTILSMYKDNYTNLFITLANKYQIQDLSLFAGVNFD